MKDEKEVRKILKLNTDSLGVQLEILSELGERQIQLLENDTRQLKLTMSLLREIENLKEKVKELEKKREWVN